MKIYFIYPAWNATILVDNLDRIIDREDYVNVSNTLLQENQHFEQVGFIEIWDKCKYRCQMMWWEFCINAMRSLAFWVNEKFWENKFELESSGTNDVFTMEIENWVSICLNKKYKIEKIKENLILVQLEWISHFVQTIKNHEWNEQKTKRLFHEMMQEYKNIFESNPAIGLISIDEFNTIYPLVFVKATNTLIFESACGSGTLAAFIASNKVVNCFVQPSNCPYFVEEKDNCFVLKSRVSNI